MWWENARAIAFCLWYKGCSWRLRKNPRSTGARFPPARERRWISSWACSKWTEVPACAGTTHACRFVWDPGARGSRLRGNDGLSPNHNAIALGRMRLLATVQRRGDFLTGLTRHTGGSRYPGILATLGLYSESPTLNFYRYSGRICLRLAIV